MTEKYSVAAGEISIISEKISKRGKATEDAADFETAISATGFGKFNILLLLIGIPSGFASMFCTTTMSYVIPAAHCDLNLSLNDKGFINATIYLGMITSAFIWGFLADTLGRRKLLIAGYMLDAIFVILAALSQNLPMIMFAKFMDGFLINGPFAAFTTVLSEFHCAKYRARVLMLMGIIYNSATLTLPMLGWAILPRNMDVTVFGWLELHSWNFFILVSALPSLISSLAHVTLPESPKFLMMVGRNEEALEVFRKVYSSNTGKPPETYPVKTLIDEIKLRENESRKHGGHITASRTKIQALKEGWQQITPLFYPPWLSKIILVFAIQFGFMMGLNTLRLWLPQIFTAMNDYEYYHRKEASNESASLCTMLELLHPNTTSAECVVNSVNDSVYINSIIVSCTTIIGYLVAGTLINKLGKKLLLCSMGTISGSCAILMYFSRSTQMTTALSSLFSAFGSICTNGMLTVVVDLFPTSLRTITVASMMMFGRTGAMIGNAIFPTLLSSGCLPPFLLVGFAMLCCASLCLILPKTDLKALE